MASKPTIRQNHASQTATFARLADALKQPATQNITLYNHTFRYCKLSNNVGKTFPPSFLLYFATHLPNAGTDLRFIPAQPRHSSNKTTISCTQKGTIRIISILDCITGDLTSASSKPQIEESDNFVLIFTTCVVLDDAKLGDTLTL